MPTAPASAPSRGTTSANRTLHRTHVAVVGHLVLPQRRRPGPEAPPGPRAVHRAVQGTVVGVAVPRVRDPLRSHRRVHRRVSWCPGATGAGDFFRREAIPRRPAIGAFRRSLPVGNTAGILPAVPDVLPAVRVAVAVFRGGVDPAQTAPGGRGTCRHVPPDGPLGPRG